MKRFRGVLAVLCAAAVLICPVSAAPVADTEAGETWEELTGMDEAAWETMTGGVETVEAEALEVGGQSAILISLSGGEVLFEKNADARLPIASVTKIMTLLLTMEAIDNGLLGYNDVLTCSAEAASLGGSQIWLEPGETMTVDDLLKAVAVVSANDACAVLAEALAGSIEGFVQRMNQRAAELGMENTHFLDSCGLNDEAYSSARDVAIMSRELMTHEGITRYTTIWMDSLRGGESELVNTNKMIRFYDGATGLKTGTTSTAGHCLSATAERGGFGLCAVILGCETTAERFGGARKLLDYGYANYALYTPPMEDAALSPVKVLHGVETTVTPVTDGAQALLLRRGQEAGITTEVTLCTDVEAPVLPDQVLGEITFSLDGETLARYPIRAARAVDRLNFWGALQWLWQALVGGFKNV